MKGDKRPETPASADANASDAAAARQPASASKNSNTPAAPPPDHRLTPAAAIKNSRGGSSKASRGSKLLKATELGGGAATDLGQALLEAAPGDEDIDILIAALRMSRRHARSKAKGRKPRGSAARRRSIDMLGVITLGGGTPASLMDTLARQAGSDAGDLALVRAALQTSASTAGPSNAAAAEADAPPTAVPGDRQAGAAAAAADGAAEAPPLKSDGGQMCRVCRTQERAAGNSRLCARCTALVAQLHKESGGLCRRVHVRSAFDELGSDARLPDVKRRALDIAGVAHASDAAAAEAANAEPPQPAAKAAPRGAAATEAVVATCAAVDAAVAAAALAGGSGSAAAAKRGCASAEAAPSGAAEQVAERQPKAQRTLPPQAPEPAARDAAPRRAPPAPARVTSEPEQAAAAHASAPAMPAEPASEPGAAAAAPVAGIPAACTAAAADAPTSPTPAGSIVTNDTELEGDGPPPQGGRRDPPAPPPAPVRLCSVCANRERVAGGCYCRQCRSLASMLKGRGVVPYMREAYRALGLDAPRVAVKEFVKNQQEAAEALEGAPAQAVVAEAGPAQAVAAEAGAVEAGAAATAEAAQAGPVGVGG